MTDAERARLRDWATRERARTLALAALRLRAWLLVGRYSEEG